jgi:hypothetical protein
MLNILCIDTPPFSPGRVVLADNDHDTRRRVLHVQSGPVANAIDWRAAGMSGALRSVIENGYAGTIRRKMDDVYRNAGVGRGEMIERESRAAFVVRGWPLSSSGSCYIGSPCRYH